jgi:hypothetical protein
MRRNLLLVGAAGVFVSGYIHYYLYFYGGYRGIMPDEVAGMTISRAFAINAIAGLLLAELLVAAYIWPRLAPLAAVLGAGFAASTLLAYLLTRTTGILGFSDDQTSTEAVIAVAAELVALGVLVTYLVGWVRDRAPARTAATG